jgi:hypothetical protein
LGAERSFARTSSRTCFEARSNENSAVSSFCFSLCKNVIDFPSGENAIERGTCQPGSGHLLIRSNVMGLASGPAIAARVEPFASAGATVAAGGGARGVAGAHAESAASTQAQAARRGERFRVMASD